MKIAVCVEANPGTAALGATALALGLDDAEVCWVHAGNDTFAPNAVPRGVASVVAITGPELARPHSQSLAHVLLTAVQRMGCDAIFCGVLSNAAGTGLLGAALAVQWNVPFVAQAHAAHVRGKHMHVAVHGASQIATVALPWPCVVACVPASADLPMQEAAPQVRTFTLPELGIATEAIRRSSESISAPIALRRTKTVTSVEALLESLLDRSH